MRAIAAASQLAATLEQNVDVWGLIAPGKRHPMGFEWHFNGIQWSFDGTSTRFSHQMMGFVHQR